MTAPAEPTVTVPREPTDREQLARFLAVHYGGHVPGFVLEQAWPDYLKDADAILAAGYCRVSAPDADAMEVAQKIRDQFYQDRLDGSTHSSQAIERLTENTAAALASYAARRSAEAVAAIGEWSEARRAVSQEQSVRPYMPGAGPGMPSDMRLAQATTVLERIAKRIRAGDAAGKEEA